MKEEIKEDSIEEIKDEILSNKKENKEKSFKFYYFIIVLIFIIFIFVWTYISNYDNKFYEIKSVYSNINDNKSYKFLKLNNNIKVVIINKPKTFKYSIFSFSVKFGTSNDPKNFRGLSHILEHLIFKRCKNYPYFNLNKILKKYNGSYNANTNFEKTTYYFTIKSEGLRELTEILIDCLNHPIITINDIKKELININSELIWKEVSTKNFEIYKLLEWIVNQKSDLFNDGIKLNYIKNDKILKSLRKKLLLYHKNFYNSNNIAVAILTNLNSYQLKNDFLVKLEDINKINLNNLNKNSEEIFLKRDIRTTFYLKNALKNNYSELVLNFDINKEILNDKKDFIKLFSIILNLNEENSFKNLLIMKKNWIFGLKDDIINENQKHILYSINFKLTILGEKNIENIIKLFFNFIFKLKNGNYNDLYDSISKINKLIYIFDKKQIDNEELVVKISKNLHNYVSNEINYRDELIINYDKNIKNNFFDFFKFNKCIFIINSNKFKTNPSNIFYESSRDILEDINPHLKNIKKQLNELEKIENKLVTKIKPKNKEIIKINPFKVDFNYEVNYFLLDNIYYKQFQIYENYEDEIKKENKEIKIPKKIEIDELNPIVYTNNCSKDKKLNYYNLTINDKNYNINSLITKDLDFFLNYITKLKKERKKLNECLIDETKENISEIKFNKFKNNNINFYYNFINVQTIPKFFVDLDIKSNYLFDLLDKKKFINNSIYINLICMYFEKIIKIKFYKEILIGFKFKCINSNYNIKFSYNGYSENLFKFVENSIDYLFTFKIDKNILRYVKYRYIYNIKEIGKMNNLEANIFYFETLINNSNINYINTKNKNKGINIIKKIKSNDFKNLIWNILNKIKLNALIIGKNDRMKIFEEFIVKKFSSFKLDFDNDKGFNLDFKVKSHSKYKIYSHNKKDLNNSYLSCYKIGTIPNKFKIFLAIFNKILNYNIYEEIKNRNDLGYVANSFIKKIDYNYYNCIIIDGNNIELSKIEIIINNIITLVIKYFTNLPKIRFKKLANNNIHLLNQNLKYYEKINHRFIDTLKLREDLEYSYFINNLHKKEFLKFVNYYYQKKYKRITIEIFQKINKNFKSKSELKIKNFKDFLSK